MYELEISPGKHVTVISEIKDLTSDIVIPAGSMLEVVRSHRDSTVVLKYNDSYVTLELKYLNRIDN